MMKCIEEVADGTYRLEAHIPGPTTTFSAYFIKENSGILIEPGPAALIPDIEAAIKELAMSNLEYIIPTHIHLDHAGALGKLTQIFPQATAVANPQGAKHVIDPSRLIQSTKMSFGEFETVYGNILPVPKPRLKIVQDNERLSVDNWELTIIYTPGHAPHHIAIFDTKTRGLFCGEALGLIYRAGSPPLPAVAPPSFDADMYPNSMERLRQLRPKLLFYSHGGVGNEPEKLISSAIENTRLVGDAILRALKLERTEEAVIHYIGEYIQNRFGVRLDEYDLATNVRGYIHYFKKKGMSAAF